MAQIIRRRGSPFWYARFSHGGKPYLVSTKTANRREALRFLAKAQLKAAGERSAEDASRAVLETLGIAVSRDEDAVRRLKRELIARTDADETVAALADRLRSLAEEAAPKPAALASLTENRRRWARTILGAQGTAVGLDAAWNAWSNAPRKYSATESTMATAYEPVWRKFTRWAADRGIKHLHDLTPTDAATYLTHLQAQRLAARTIRNHRGFLVAMWNTLKLQAGLTDNPWAALPAPEAEPSVRRALTLGELKRLFAAATDPEDRLAISLGLFAALRLGDVANLTWSAVRLDEGLIVLQPHKTRRYGREVRIPIHPVLRQALSAHRATAEAEWVCPQLHALYSSGRVNAGKRILAIFKRADIRLVAEATSRRRRAPSLGAFHALRHSFISFAARAGVPQLAVRAIVGHSNAATTRLYEHVDTPTLRKAVAALPALKIEGEGK